MVGGLRKIVRSWAGECAVLGTGFVYAFFAGRALARLTGAVAGSGIWEVALGALLGYLWWLVVEFREPDPPGAIDGNVFIDQMLINIALASWAIHQWRLI